MAFVPFASFLLLFVVYFIVLLIGGGGRIMFTCYLEAFGIGVLAVGPTKYQDPSRFQG